MKNGGNKGSTIIIVIVLIAAIIFGIASCGGGASSSSYQLHNSDGSINWDYYNDMQNYFAKHPEKLP